MLNTHGEPASIAKEAIVKIPFDILGMLEDNKNVSCAVLAKKRGPREEIGLMRCQNHIYTLRPGLDFGL